MIQTHEFMTISIKRTQVRKPVLVSEKLISLLFGILVAVFYIGLALGFQSLVVYLSSRTWKWHFSAPSSDIIFFVFALTLLSVLVLFLFKLYRVVKNLFQAFWESLKSD